jgi:hypothetical protein
LVDPEPKNLPILAFANPSFVKKSFRSFRFLEMTFANRWKSTKEKRSRRDSNHQLFCGSMRKYASLCTLAHHRFWLEVHQDALKRRKFVPNCPKLSQKKAATG